MNRYFDPNTLARTYRDPVALAILVVDLFPIFAVIGLGWGAVPLVFLYWLENLVIGVMALARMLATSMKGGPLGALGMVFIGPFFVVHYGMFCFVHGVLLAGFAEMSADGSGMPDFPTPLGLIEAALSSGPYLPTFLLIIIILQIFLFVRDFLMRGQYLDTDMNKEMAAPYGRVVVLHFALFAGAFALIAFGEPMLGVLFLIVLRAVWGMVLTVGRRLRIDDAQTES
ncbi:MAG: DUF6498-containing protein [Henriciella sp.]|nr:DUF6498-containing protein [Henriciella sp.]